MPAGPISEAFIAILPAINEAAFSSEVEAGIESAVSRVGTKAFAPLEVQAAKAGQRAGAALDESFGKASTALTSSAAKTGEKAGAALDASFGKAVAPLGKEAAAASEKAGAVGAETSKSAKSGLVGLAALAGGYELVKGSIEAAQQRQLDIIQSTEVFSKQALPAVTAAVDEVSKHTFQTIELTRENIDTLGRSLQAVGVTQKQSIGLSAALAQRVGDVAAQTGKDVGTLIASVQTSIASGSTRALKQMNVVADNSDIAFTAAKSGIVQLVGTSKDLASAQGTLVKLQGTLTDAQDQYGKHSTQALAVQQKIAYQQTVIGNLQKTSGAAQKQQMQELLSIQGQVTTAQTAYKAAVDKFGPSSAQAAAAQKKYNSLNADFLAQVKTSVPSLTKQQKALAVTQLILDKTTNAQGASEKKSKTFAGSLQTLKTAFENLEEEIGAKIIPVLTKAANGAANFIGFLEAHKTTVKIITSALALLGGTILTYITITKVAAAATKFFAAAQGVLDAVLDANPITIVIVALAALGVALVEAYKHSKTFRTIIDDIGKFLKATFTPVLHVLAAAFDFVRDHIKLVLVLLATAFFGPIALVIALFVKFHDQIIGVFTTIYDFIKQFIADVIAFFVALPGELVSALASLGKLIGDVFTKLGSLVLTVIKAAINLWLDVYVRLPVDIVKALAGLASKVAGIFQNVGQAAESKVSSFVSNIVSDIGSIPGKITALGGKMLSAGEHLVGSFVKGLGSVGGRAVDIASGIANSMIGFINTQLIDPINSGINHLSHILGDAIPGPTPNLPDLPHIPQFAKGAVVDKPTLGWFGEAGREVVIPMTDKKRAFQLASQSGLLDLLVSQANKQARGSLAAVTGDGSTSTSTSSRVTHNHNTFVLPAADPNQHADMVGHRLSTWSDR